jgi:hypothetical protein
MWFSKDITVDLDADLAVDVAVDVALDKDEDVKMMWTWN